MAKNVEVAKHINILVKDGKSIILSELGKEERDTLMRQVNYRGLTENGYIITNKNHQAAP